MYNEISYEEYMRSVLGYNPRYYREDLYANDNYYIMQERNMPIEDNMYHELYPEIYHKIYPLICNECANVTMPITNDILEQMTDNVIRGIEIDLKIETRKIRQEDRQSGRNNFLRDLIKILILKQIIGGNIQNPRPPFPAGPNQGQRPSYSPQRPTPIMPR